MPWTAQGFFDLCDLGPAPGSSFRGIGENVFVDGAQGVITRQINAGENLTAADRDRVRLFFQTVLSGGAGPRLSSFTPELSQRARETFSEDWSRVEARLQSHPETCAVQDLGAARKTPSIIPYVGGSFQAPAVADEVVRCLKDAALSCRVVKPSLAHRVIQKLRTDPRDTFFAAARRMRRGPSGFSD